MKQYIGTKIVLASPMARGEYNAYRGWTPPEGEDQAVDGYLVEYQDGGQPNDSRHGGYISWSPKAAFDAAYVETGYDGVLPLPPHQQRVLAEKAELDDRLKKLATFIGGGAYLQRVGASRKTETVAPAGVHDGLLSSFGRAHRCLFIQVSCPAVRLGRRGKID